MARLLLRLPLTSWTGEDERLQMLQKVKRLFVIKTRIEAFIIIYALALGATARGAHYLTDYPGWGGKLLFLACSGAVFLAGAKILDALRYERESKEAKGALAGEQSGAE